MIDVVSMLHESLKQKSYDCPLQAKDQIENDKRDIHACFARVLEQAVLYVY